MPVKYPELFQGLLSPWKGLLLFGPPGTGKTMLAKAVATECKTTFFNISASTIVSKVSTIILSRSQWRGDSEKLVRVLFDLAKYHSPSTIFLDEIDALMSQRGDDGGGEHEASRRMKTELLIQMDGLARSNDKVFVLCVSNLPWILDTALLRRLEKRIFVGLPNQQARRDIFQELLSKNKCAELSWDDLALKTEGYSGSDLRILCKEAAMAPVRRLLDRLESGDSEVTIQQLEAITHSDVEVAVTRSHPSASHSLQSYHDWYNKFGSQ